MNRVVRFLLIPAVVAVFGCNGNSPEEGVDVLSGSDISDEGDLTQIACDFKVVPLKSDEPIDAIGGIKFFGDKAFARNGSSDKILCFDNYQIYAVLNRLGRGPGEYTYISDFTYNADANLLYIPNDTVIWQYDATTMEYLGKRNVNFYIQNMLNVGDKILYNGIPMDEYRKVMHGEYNGIHYSVALADALEDNISGKATILSRHNFLHELLWGSPQIFYVNPANRVYSLPGYVNRIVSFNEDSISTIYKFRLEAIDPPEKFRDDECSGFDDYYTLLTNWIEEMQDKPAPVEIFNIIDDKGTISFMMEYLPEGMMNNTEHLYWVHDKSGTKAYRKLRIPGLADDIQPTGCHDNRNVAIIENFGDLAIDPNSEISPLARQILDAMKTQNDENPILLEFRFK